MTNADAAPGLHRPLEAQLSIARLELGVIADSLWQATSYNRDILTEAIDAFPAPAQRRSDTEFTTEAEHEAVLRKKAAILGPGREGTESLDDLGVYTVDAETIEPGQLHKTVTEIWRALRSSNQAPVIVFASDRTVPRWAENKEGEQLDAERLSTHRLLTIGGQGLTEGASFFRRVGSFDALAKINGTTDETIEAALAFPDTEYEVTERFLGGALDEVADSVLTIGYDRETGQVFEDETGQVRQLGYINGRRFILVHKEHGQDGKKLDTTDTILMLGGIAAALTSSSETVMSYWTSSTYKPSRWMSGIRAGIKAAREGQKLRVAVPTYGYADLSMLKGEDNPTPPTIQNIAGEMGKAAQEALELRAFLDSLL